MNIIRLDSLPKNLIREYGSSGARVVHLLSATKQPTVVRIQLEHDGVLGMHEAAEDQLFIVVKGSGLACSKKCEPVEVTEGDIVFWRIGELHETRAGPDGLTAIVVEGPSLSEALQIE